MLLDIFKGDLFSTMTLTAAIQDVPFVPGRVGELGWFDEEGIFDTTVVIEKENNTLVLVENKPRGSNGQVVGADKRTGIPFQTTHLPQYGAIMADEVLGVREFGSNDSRQSIQAVINKRLEKMRRNLDATHEYHRLGAIKGIIFDSNGSTVIADLFQRFGLTQQYVDMALGTDATKVRAKCDEILTKVEDALENWGFTGARALCGQQFWRDFITHPKVEETYLNYQAAAELRGDTREAFEFGGIIWERYRGKVNGQFFVGTDEAHVVPEGVPDLFISRFAPGDFMEAAGTMGLPYYVKSEMMRMDKGIELEAQSNPIHLCTRPTAVIRLYRIAKP